MVQQQKSISSKAALEETEYLIHLNDPEQQQKQAKDQHASVPNDCSSYSSAACYEDDSVRVNAAEAEDDNCSASTLTNGSDSPHALYSTTEAYVRIRRYMKWFFIVNCFIFLMFFAIIFIGAEVEGKRVRDKTLPVENRSWAYNVPDVCGYGGDFMTFANESEAREDSNQVAHCGNCGECSTVQDIFIINKTSGTLTDTTTFCAKQVMNIFAGGGGRAAVVSCIEEKVGFTPACGNCWVDNVMCDYKYCLMTCIRSVFFYGESNNKGSDTLNDCLNCDEVMCGPEFILCAGANRRRAGIITDIDRDEDNEVCEKVDDGWLAEAMAAEGISNRK